MSKNNKLDFLGCTISGLCIIHCLLFPFLFIIYPFLEFNEEIFHLFFLILTIIVSALSFYSGYKQHRNLKIAFLFILGIMFLSINLIFHEYLSKYELFINICGSLLIIIGHLNNKSHCKKCNH